MSKKAVVLKRNSGDAAKVTQLKGISPIKWFEYTSASQMANDKTDFGAIDYILVTGGHGDFVNNKPTKFNDADIGSARQWIGNIKGSFKIILLDTCFSSALAGAFMKFLPYGGCVVCAHGTGEGWASGFTAANKDKTIGAVLEEVVTNFESFIGSFSSISLAIKKPDNQLLYTANGGANRGVGLANRSGIGMEADTEIELKEVDMYLKRDGISVVEKPNDELIALLKEHLKITIV